MTIVLLYRGIPNNDRIWHTRTYQADWLHFNHEPTDFFFLFSTAVVLLPRCAHCEPHAHCYDYLLLLLCLRLWPTTIRYSAFTLMFSIIHAESNYNKRGRGQHQLYCYLYFLLLQWKHLYSVCAQYPLFHAIHIGVIVSNIKCKAASHILLFSFSNLMENKIFMIW